LLGIGFSVFFFFFSVFFFFFLFFFFFGKFLLNIRFFRRIRCYNLTRKMLELRKICKKKIARKA